jgi:stearoyl-CoA desaturase (delta-9 desaturase)
LPLPNVAISQDKWRRSRSGQNQSPEKICVRPESRKSIPVIIAETAVDAQPVPDERFVGRNGTNWASVIAFSLFHIGAVAALFFFSWPAFLTAVALYWLSLSLGIGMGYHRLLTHRSYKVPKWFEYSLAVLGTLALEGGPIFWVAIHRAHHQYSDKYGDPHTPREGKWWAHLIWMLVGDATHCNLEKCAKYAPDLVKDRFHVWLSRYHYVPLALVGIGLLVFGGLPFLLWGLFFRVSAGQHATWLVNSATHLWGRRRFETRDDSRNNWWVALVTFGEGWHNNHHAHPTSARHGLAWYEVDITWMTIWFFRTIGLARSVRVASARKANVLSFSASPAARQPREQLSVDHADSAAS